MRAGREFKVPASSSKSSSNKNMLDLLPLHNKLNYAGWQAGRPSQAAAAAAAGGTRNMVNDCVLMRLQLEYNCRQHLLAVAAAVAAL